MSDDTILDTLIHREYSLNVPEVMLPTLQTPVETIYIVQVISTTRPDIKLIVPLYQAGFNRMCALYRLPYSQRRRLEFSD